MSQVIDTKVVEMQFDNSKFEKNVEISLNSLKNLNKNVEDAGKNRNSLDELARAGDRVGLSFENVNQKSRISLNLMDLIAGAGAKAFNRISDAVAGFALNMANSLSGMQAMRDGFNEYELKMGSVQTILNGAKIIDPKSGKNIEDSAKRLDIVNQKLEDLNKYSDKTIYSFKDMTSNIGKFTNAGVNLDDAVGAIQGVANVAAVSGANAQEASRAMYNFSQALSSGSVKLIDWKSIENANMATMDFKQQLLDTAVALGTVTKEGNKYNTVTTDAKGKTFDAFNASSKFNDSLSAQWMTTEVLTQTLQNYSTDVNEMTVDEIKAYKAKLKSIGYTDKQVEGIVKLSKKAFAAATEVKTFSQMIDTLKESLGSGWAQSFEIIFGDFEESKKLWTELNNTIDGILSPIAKARNEMLRIWKEDGGREAIIQSFRNLYHAVENIIAPLKELWKAFTPNTSNTGKILSTISKGLEKLTSVVRKAASVVGKALATVLKPVIFIGNLIGKGLIKLVGKIQTAFKKIIKFFKPVKDALVIFTTTLKSAFDAHITARIKAFQKSLSTAFDNLKTQIKNNAVLMRLVEAFKALRDSIQDLFGRVLRNAGFYASEFVTYLERLWNAVSPLVSSAIVKTLKVIAGVLLPALRKGLNLVIGGLTTFKNLISKIDIRNSKFYKGISELPEKLKKLSENKKLNNFFTTIKNFGSEAITFLSDKFKSLKSNIEAIHTPTGLLDLFENIKNFIKGIFGKNSVEDYLTDSLKDASEATGNVVDKNSGENLTLFQKFLSGVTNALEWLSAAAIKTKDVLKDFINFIRRNTPKAIKALHDFIAGDDGILTMSDVTDIVYMVSEALSTLITSMGFQSFGDGIKTLSEAFGGLTTSLNNFLKQSANKARMEAIKDFALAIGILSGALYILSKIPTTQLIGAVSALGIVGLGLIKFFDMISSTNFTAAKIAGNLTLSVLLLSIGAAMAGMAVSIAALVGALAMFPKVIKQYNDLGEEFRTGMERVKEVLGEIFEYLEHTVHGKYALRSAIALFVLVSTLKKMRQVIVDFASEETGNVMAAGLLKIKQILNMLGSFLQSVTLVNFTGINIGANFNTLGIAVMIWALGDLLTKIIPVLEKAGAIPLKTMSRGLDVVEKILLRLGLFITAMNAGSLLKVKGGGTGLKEWIGVSLTIAILSNAIGSVVGSIETLTKLATGNTASGFDEAVETIQGIFIGLLAIMTIVGLFPPSGGGALFMLSVSIGLLVLCLVALMPIASTNPRALAEAVGAVGGLMIALGAALFLARKASKEITLNDIFLLITMTGAMLVLASAIRRLAKGGGKAGNIISAGLAIGAAVLAMVGALYLLSQVPTIPTSVLVGLGILTVAIWGFVYAVRALKGSAGQVTEASGTIKSGIQDMGDGANEALGSLAMNIDVGSLIQTIGGKIGEKIRNFDLGSFIREKFEQIKADAINWAQDFIDVGTNIINGLSTAISNPANVEMVKQAFVDLGKALLESFKLFFGINSPSKVMAEQGGFIIDGLVKGLMDYPGKLAGWIGGIGKYIIDGIGGFLSGVVEKGRNLGESLGEGIQNGKDFVVKKASELGSSALKKVGKVKEWGLQAVSSANAYGSKLQGSKSFVKRAAGSMIVGATTVIMGVAKTFGKFASTASAKFASEIRSGSGPAKAAGKALLEGAKAAFNNIRSSFKAFGENAAQGFKNGIHSLIESVAEKAREMVRRAKNAAKAEQNSNSPSKDFMEFGGWAAEGYAIGMTNRKSTQFVEKNAQKLVDAAKNVVTNAKFGISSLYLDSNPAVGSLAYAMSQISDAIDSEIDSTPIIRPVIDMSNVNHNMSAISAMFGDERLKASLEATRYVQSDFDRVMMNRQNGMMSMKSIEKLANRIDGMTEAMNSRSMTTYVTVDGSDDPMLFADKLIRGMKLNARSM